MVSECEFDKFRALCTCETLFEAWSLVILWLISEWHSESAVAMF
ncbi:hypothetical protein SLEP1_g52801 [Rubroshorea leprosula]|uniref:Uncharacterized protein n=1 Tax=Rubroshorea leprosula TaxID=152421 RepID=A0AAV5M874_9ROSI|nr:hypothetical protein SLEP1_g52801 [Rubroshorea leprosula]